MVLKRAVWIGFTLFFCKSAIYLALGKPSIHVQYQFYLMVVQLLDVGMGKFVCDEINILNQTTFTSTSISVVKKSLLKISVANVF